MARKRKAAMKLHPEVLKKNGRKEFVVLPYEEFVALREQLEDALDLVALRRAILEDDGGPGVSLAELQKRLGMLPKRRRRTTRIGR